MHGRFDYWLMLALLAAAALLAITVRRGQATPLRKQFGEFPMKVGEWQGRTVNVSGQVLEMLGATDVLNCVYRRGDDEVGFYIGYYAWQRAGESMHSPKNCLPSSGWEMLEQRRGPLAIPAAGKSVEVNHSIVENGPESQYVIYWYETRGHSFASEYQGKAILMWQALRTGRSDGAMIRVLCPLRNGVSKQRAEAVSVDFICQVYPLLKEYLPE
jgi:EpsI family protein